jgi:ribosomal subunit interface protein
MKIPLQITVRNLDLSETFKTEIRNKAENLDKFYDQIMRCRVVVEVPHRHSREGILYKVHIHMTVPGNELAVERELAQDLEVAIRDAFDAARRKLEDFARLQRGATKHHEELPHARISAISMIKVMDFTTPDNRRYISMNTVL